MRHAIQNRVYNPVLDEAEERESFMEAMESFWGRRHQDLRNGGYQYWNEFYLSGPRGFAKRSTNRRIRQQYREMIANNDPEDIMAHQGSEYQKEFDYAWTIW